MPITQLHFPYKSLPNSCKELLEWEKNNFCYYQKSSLFLMLFTLQEKEQMAVGNLRGERIYMKSGQVCAVTFKDILTGKFPVLA